MLFRHIQADSESSSKVNVVLPSSFKEGTQWIDLFSGNQAQVIEGQFRIQSDSQFPIALRDLLPESDLVSVLQMDDLELSDDLDRSGMAIWVLDSHPCLLSLPPLTMHLNLFPQFK